MASNRSLKGHALPPHFFFLPTEESDLPYIAWWMATKTEMPEEHMQQIVTTLLQHLRGPGDPTKYASWIAIADGQRAFFLEFIAAEYIYLTFSPKLAKQPGFIHAAWQASLAHVFPPNPQDPNSTII